MPDEDPLDGGGPLRLAHRGDHRRLPENSVAALVAGARAPRSDGVEFDVRLSRDGVPMLVHDTTLDRVRGVPARVDDLSAAELRRYDVPTLEEALAALPATAFLDVELKVVPGAETAAMLIAARGANPARAVVSSFQPAALEALATLAPDWPRWANVRWVDEAIVGLALGLGCRGIAAVQGVITPHTARLVADAGLALVAWTVTRRPTFERLTRLGVAAACVEGSLLDA